MYQFSIEDFSTFAKLSINDFRDLASFTLKILPQFQELIEFLPFHLPIAHMLKSLLKLSYEFA